MDSDGDGCLFHHENGEYSVLSFEALWQVTKLVEQAFDELSAGCFSNLRANRLFILGPERVTRSSFDVNFFNKARFHHDQFDSGKLYEIIRIFKRLFLTNRAIFSGDALASWARIIEASIGLENISVKMRWAADSLWLEVRRISLRTLGDCFLPLVLDDIQLKNIPDGLDKLCQVPRLRICLMRYVNACRNAEDAILLMELMARPVAENGFHSKTNLYDWAFEREDVFIIIEKLVKPYLCSSRIYRTDPNLGEEDNFPTGNNFFCNKYLRLDYESDLARHCLYNLAFLGELAQKIKPELLKSAKRKVKETEKSNIRLLIGLEYYILYKHRYSKGFKTTEALPPNSTLFDHPSEQIRFRLYEFVAGNWPNEPPTAYEAQLVKGLSDRSPIVRLLAFDAMQALLQETKSDKKLELCVTIANKFSEESFYFVDSIPLEITTDLCLIIVPRLTEIEHKVALFDKVVASFKAYMIANDLPKGYREEYKHSYDALFRTFSQLMSVLNVIFECSFAPKPVSISSELGCTKHTYFMLSKQLKVKFGLFISYLVSEGVFKKLAKIGASRRMLELIKQLLAMRSDDEVLGLWDLAAIALSNLPRTNPTTPFIRLSKYVGQKDLSERELCEIASVCSIYWTHAHLRPFYAAQLMQVLLLKNSDCVRLFQNPLIESLHHVASLTRPIYQVGPEAKMGGVTRQAQVDSIWHVLACLVAKEYPMMLVVSLNDVRIERIRQMVRRAHSQSIFWNKCFQYEELYDYWVQWSRCCLATDRSEEKAPVWGWHNYYISMLAVANLIEWTGMENFKFNLWREKMSFVFKFCIPGLLHHYNRDFGVRPLKWIKIFGLSAADEQIFYSDPDSPDKQSLHYHRDETSSEFIDAPFEALAKALLSFKKENKHDFRRYLLSEGVDLDQAYELMSMID